MSLFLSKEEQLFTDSILSIGLWFTSEKHMFDIITAYYINDCIEYYLFNKVKIWVEKVRNAKN